jgi:hypothetical protein
MTWTKKQADAFERTQRWRECSEMLRAQNPLCQALDEHGNQCVYPARLCHHIVEPECEPTLALDPSNLVAVCNEHHPRTPGYMHPSGYVATVVSIAGEVTRYEHKPAPCSMGSVTAAAMAAIDAREAQNRAAYARWQAEQTTGTAKRPQRIAKPQ